MQGKVIEFELLNCMPNDKHMLWQYDYGKKMRLIYPDLPSTYEVHFSNSDKGDSVFAIGTADDGVEIPAQMTQSGKPVYFWLFMHETLSSGETIFGNIIRVKQRGKLPTSEPTPEQRDIIEDLLAALTAGVEEVEQAVSDIQETVDAALQAAKDSGEFDGPKGDPGEPGKKGDPGAPGEVTEAHLQEVAATKADKANTVLTTTLSRGRKANTTVGVGSIAFGNDVEASGEYSVAVGTGTKASGKGAFAEGFETYATAIGAHSEGANTYAYATCSHAEGDDTYAGAYACHVEGYGTYAYGYYSHAEGYDTYTYGSASHSEGYYASAYGDFSHAEGRDTESNGICSHVEGDNTIAQGSFSHVFGISNVVDSYDNWPEWVSGTEYAVGDKVKYTYMGTLDGFICKTANSDVSFTKSNWTQQYRKMNFVEIVGNGSGNKSSNARSLDWDGNERLAGYLFVGCNPDSTGGKRVATDTDTELQTTLSRGRLANSTVGYGSFAFGSGVTASDSYSHAEGAGTTASGAEAHAEGAGTTASGMCSHAEGGGSRASGGYSHAEGGGTLASGVNAHAEGGGTYATEECSHAEGGGTYANGTYSHSEGLQTVANGSCSHVGGTYNVEDNYDNWDEWEASKSYAVGNKVKITTTENEETTVTAYICNTANNDSTFDDLKWDRWFLMNYAEIVGNGKYGAKSNARTLDWQGNERLMGSLYVGCNPDGSGGTEVIPVAFATDLETESIITSWGVSA